MRKLASFSITVGIVVFLCLTSSVSYAAWTASSTRTATATTGAVALSTSTSSGAATITALGPHTYTATNETVKKPITVRNTGSVAATVSSIAISRTGTLGDNQITVKFWAGTSSSCAATTPIVSTALNVGSVSLSSLNMTIAASGSAILCASTTFDGDVLAQAGRSANVTFQLKSSAGTNWIASDSLDSNDRSFTQSIVLKVAPNEPRNVECSNNGFSGVTVEWSTPTGFVTPNGGYRVYFNGAYVTSTSNKWIDLYSDGDDTGDVTIRAVALDGTESADSDPIPLTPQNKNGGLRCGK
ncbi:hypothetical protein [Salinibacterium sp. M195]|uniref:hypothetical protein n=1 Tax=Salinibacterium sp. M195 TaxID=2583374 RepID=UPI001C625A8B|nr:hypothetical protein [Salinibacterium sp. M195]QYH35312.1 fibronectin type III domain-containing protein [Salinibacterium sp. M195]